MGELVHSQEETQRAVDAERQRLLDEFLHGQRMQLMQMHEQLAAKQPVDNPRERRALALRFAIDTRITISFESDKSLEEKGQQLIDLADVFDAYIAGDEA